jgi:ribonuclease HI
MEQEILAVYADGGVIGRNPSAEGGTWAWCHVNTSRLVVPVVSVCIVASGKGYLHPRDAQTEKVTNNQTEYWALLQCLKALPDGWSGPVYSDSAITLGRFGNGWKHDGIPGLWEVEMHEARQRLGKLTWNLLDGHPTRAQLEAGKGKRGGAVSVFNAWADARCTELAKEYALLAGASTR